MSDEGTSSWSLNLDSDDAQSAIDGLKSGLSQFAGTDFTELLSTLGEVTTVIGAIGAAALVIGAAFEDVFDAEAIEQANEEFSVFARNAGLAGDSLKAALVNSSAGLVDETTLLKGASEAMAMLGQNSGQLPQIMDLARKATDVFGGDIMANFNGITQAIASGNTRALKHLGIIVDQQKAYDTYAASIGVVSSELSEEGKQHAMLNAVMAAGNTEFQGIAVGTKVATDTWKEFKAAVTDLADSMKTALAGVLGPSVKAILTGLKELAVEGKNAFNAAFGTGVVQAQANLDQLTTHMKVLQATLAAAETHKNNWIENLFGQNSQELIKQTQAEIAKTQKQIDTAQATVAKGAENSAKRQIASDNSVARNSEVNQKQLAADRLKFNTELDALRTKNDEADIKSADTIEKVDEAHAAKKIALVKANYDAVAKMEQQAGGTAITRAAMKKQLDDKLTADLKANDASLYADRQKSLVNLENENASAANKIANVWKAESQKQALQLTDFTKLAQTGFSTVQSSATSAFEAMGDGSESAGDAMKGFMFNSLGGIAEAAGQVVLGESIFPPNPLGLAAGGGLLMLGAFLKSMGKGSSSSVPSVSASGGSSSTTSAAPTAAAQTAAAGSSGPGAAPTQQQSVNFVVQGNLYNSNEAKLEMMDIMRSATDATDFKYAQVGGPNT